MNTTFWIYFQKTKEIETIAIDCSACLFHLNVLVFDYLVDLRSKSRIRSNAHRC